MQVIISQSFKLDGPLVVLVPAQQRRRTINGSWGLSVVLISGTIFAGDNPQLRVNIWTIGVGNGSVKIYTVRGRN